MKNTVNIKIINAFSKTSNGGNPAAVVLDADRLTAYDKQLIAAKVGLSETAFISSSDRADYKFDFFTPNRQIAHCGHATIAAFAYLKQLGLIKRNHATKETIDGTRSILFDGDEVFMEQMAPRFTAPDSDDWRLIFDSIGINKTQVTAAPMMTYTGNIFLILEVTSEAVLKNLRPNHALITNLSEKYGLIGYYVFCRPANNKHDAVTRMFAPAYGITEEAATGMAAGPLACYLYHYVKKQSSYLIEQGRLMPTPSPSEIKVNMVLDGDRISGLYAGGTAVLSHDLDIEIPCFEGLAA